MAKCRNLLCLKSIAILAIVPAHTGFLTGRSCFLIPVAIDMCRMFRHDRLRCAACDIRSLTCHRDCHRAINIVCISCTICIWRDVMSICIYRSYLRMLLVLVRKFVCIERNLRICKISRLNCEGSVFCSRKHFSSCDCQSCCSGIIIIRIGRCVIVT